MITCAFCVGQCDVMDHVHGAVRFVMDHARAGPGELVTLRALDCLLRSPAHAAAAAAALGEDAAWRGRGSHMTHVVGLALSEAASAPLIPGAHGVRAVRLEWRGFYMMGLLDCDKWMKWNGMDWMTEIRRDWKGLDSIGCDWNGLDSFPFCSIFFFFF